MPLRGALTAMTTFQHRHIVDAKPLGRRIVRASSLSTLKPLSRFNALSPFNLRSKACVFFRVITIVAGTYAYSSAALAEVEEDTSEGINKIYYITPTLSDDIITDLLIGNQTDEHAAKYLSTLDNPHNGTEFSRHNSETHTSNYPAFPSSADPRGFDNALIPEAVWSLDVNTGAHLEHIADSAGFGYYTLFGGRREITDSWLKEIFGSSSGNNTSVFVAPLQFQVASCGGSSAEHSNLDYCDSANIANNQLSNNPPQTKQSDSGTTTPSGTTTQSDTTTQAASNNVLWSNGAPAFDLSAPSNTAPFTPNTAPSTPAIGDESLPSGSLSVQGPCDVSTSCATFLIYPLETPVDALAPAPLDLLNPEPPPPSPIVYVGDPEPVSGPSPVFTPQPLKPIPEASTWVMTIIGFGVMAFFFGRKRRPRINPISIIDVSGVEK